jgi:DNA-binding PadR family transcriptional regulator
METLRAWSGLSASQVYRVLADLVEDGLIAQRSRGSRGHRAEFELWPSDPEECG